MSLLKDDLSGLKSRLENIEGEFESKLKEVESKEVKFKKIDDQIDELINKKDSVIRLNIGGRIFQTKLSTLLSAKNTLFAKIITLALDKGEVITELFFDRSYNYFHLIIDFLRTKKFNPKGLSKYELNDLDAECEYYGISDIHGTISELKKEVVFVSFESAPRYSTCGTHSIEGLDDTSLMKGICVQSPYHIILELNFEHEFEKLEVGGWNGNSSLWYIGNGSGAKILTSKDKESWTEVGTLPTLSTSIQPVTLKRTTAKYIKFQHNSYVGFGYLRIIRTGQV